jgi:hypothetical protein
MSKIWRMSFQNGTFVIIFMNVLLIILISLRLFARPFIWLAILSTAYLLITKIYAVVMEYRNLFIRRNSSSNADARQVNTTRETESANDAQVMEAIFINAIATNEEADSLNHEPTENIQFFTHVITANPTMFFRLLRERRTRNGQSQHQSDNVVRFLLHILNQRLVELRQSSDFNDHSPGLTPDQIETLPIRIVEKQSEAGEKQGCSICLEDYPEGMQTRGLPCGHIFHTECIYQWLVSHNTCPNCKRRVNPN